MVFWGLLWVSIPLNKKVMLRVLQLRYGGNVIPPSRPLAESLCWTILGKIPVFFALRYCCICCFCVVHIRIFPGRGKSDSLDIQVTNIDPFFRH